MAKGQSTIVQYVLFFAIGIGLFISLGNSFLSQYTTFSRDISSTNVMLANSFVTSQVVYLYDQCRQCQQITENLTLQNVTRLFQLSLGGAGINVSAPLSRASYFSRVHNLNYTANFSSGTASLSRTINISINKDKNILGISEVR